MNDITSQYLAYTPENLHREDIKPLQELIQFHRKQYYEYEKQNDKRYNLVWEYNDNKHEVFRNRLENYESNYKTLLK